MSFLALYNSILEFVEAVTLLYLSALLLLSFTMDAAFDQIRALAKNADEAARKKILDGLRDLTYSIETPQDSVQRIIFYVSLVVCIGTVAKGQQNFRLAAARIGMDLKLFDILAESPKALTVSELSEKTGAAPLLLSRFMYCTWTVQAC